MTLRKKIISKIAFFFLVIFLIGLISSCQNFFEDSINSIEEEQSQNQNSNEETKTNQTSVKTPATNNSEPQPVIVSGNMTISGAVPEEVLPQNAPAVPAAQTDNEAARSAVPAYNASEVEYFATAVSGTRTVNGTFGTGANASTFSIALVPGLEWDITCGMRKKSSLGVSGEVLFSAVKTGVNPANLANGAVIQFYPAPDTSGGSSSTGEIELSMTVDSSITSVEVSCFGANSANWPFSSASLSGTTATIQTNLLHPSIRSGVYEVVFDFYKSGHVLAYSSVQTINICKGLKTKKWISSGGNNPIDSDGTFNVSATKIASFVNTNYYIGTISGSASPSDSNNGNHKAPFATLSKAISQIESQAAASGSATNLEYKIFISGTVNTNSASLLTYSVPELGSSLNGKASKILIKGIANSSNPPVIQCPAPTARVLTISTNVPVELNGITVTGGKATGTTGASGYGGGLYLSGNGTQVTLSNTKIEGNYASVQGGGIYVAGRASLIMKDSSEIKNNAVLRAGLSATNMSLKCAGGGVYLAENSSFTMDEGSISGNGSADAGAAVYIRGTFTMNDGQITSNKKISVLDFTNPILSNILESGDITSNVEVGLPGTFNLRGGSISSTLSDGKTGAGVCVYGDSTLSGTANFNMSGGSITGITQTSTSNAQGIVYLAASGSNSNVIFTMSGGTITGNTSNNYAGVYAGPNSSFIMTGGEISGNSITTTSAPYTAGLYYEGVPANGHAKITLGKSTEESTVKIKNNTAGSSGEKSNLRILSLTPITIAGALTTASEVGITKTTEGAFTSGYSLYNSTRQPSLIFTSDNGKNITKDDSGEAATMTAIPLTLEAVSGPATVTFMNKASGPVTYKINGGEAQTIAANTTGSISLEAAGDRVEFYGNNVTYATQTSPSSYSKINCSADCYVYGNIMSLISSSGYASAVELKDNFTFTNLFSDNTKLKNKEGQLLELPATKLKQYSYYGMFQGCTGLTVAPDLPATTLDGSCYSLMFKGCTGLTAAPSLPATTLAVSCYSSMFSGCTGLTSAPELPARTMIGTCYSSMFQDCTSLETAPELPAETLYNSCYKSMFQGCTSLTTLPEDLLPATTLKDSCYQSMFQGCTSLTTLPEDLLPATTLKDYCYQSMFQGCTGLTEAPALPATTLKEYCYYSMFSGCTGLTEAPALPATTLKEYCYYSMFDGCTGLTEAPALPATTLADYCYYLMFQGCTGFTVAPDLPATTLASYCYQYMFLDCTGLTEAPALPATTLKGYCYRSIFSGCTGLTTLPEDLLPATTLASSCYESMFSGCTGLTTLPETLLPATTLANYCYHLMFDGCTGLTEAPVLPATTLADYCYYLMFKGCTGLTEAPALNATTLATNCYYSMFDGCTGLTTLPEDLLPATTLAAICYKSMFRGCTGLTTLPEDLLPATTLTGSCYVSMFDGCTGLTTLPENLLPATTLASSCYSSMFKGCTGLTEAPALPATTLTDYCYESMFSGCSNLSSVTCLATDISAYQSTYNWLKNVGSNGIFIKTPEMASWTRGASGIPSSWVAFNPDGGTGSPATPLTLEAVSGPVTVTFDNKASGGVAYKVNGGEPQLIANSTTGTIELAAAGDKVEFYGNNTYYGSSSASDSSNISCSDDCYIYGNIMSLVDNLGYAAAVSLTANFTFSDLFNGNTKIKNKEDQPLELPATTLKNYCYSSMFSGCTGLTVAPDLPATTLANNCYSNMFSGCTGLTTAPALNATTLAVACYFSMFEGCTGLTEAPDLPATTLANTCYSTMFKDCTGLTTLPETLLPATTLTLSCYKSMFSGCTGLTTVPEDLLPATTLANYCYQSMFQSCTGLTEAPDLPSTTLATSCYYSMFQGCTGLTEAPALPSTTLADYCYQSMFQDCTGLTETPILPATTLPYSCYNSMFKDCTNLSRVTCLGRNPNNNSNTKDWLSGVSSTGTFIKNPEATNWSSGASGIPSGWVVFTPDDGSSSTSLPLTMEAVSGPVTVTFNNKASGGVAYKVNEGALQFIAARSTDSIELSNAGDKVEFYGSNDQYGSTTASNCSNISCSDDCYIYGNIMSLMNSNSYATATSIKGSSAFQGLFKGNTKIKNKEGQHIELPATTLREYCYRSMFEGCTGLTTLPEDLLPATTLANYCYLSMFYGCTGLTEAPDLPATTLATCCYYSMFQGCTGLTETPILPATTLPYSCYNSMFMDCTNLSRVTCLGTNPNPTNNYNTSSWLSGVSSTGVFIKTPEITSWPSGVNGIPSGWTVEDYVEP